VGVEKIEKVLREEGECVECVGERRSQLHKEMKLLRRRQTKSRLMRARRSNTYRVFAAAKKKKIRRKYNPEKEGCFHSTCQEGVYRLQNRELPQSSKKKKRGGKGGKRRGQAPRSKGWEGMGGEGSSGGGAFVWRKTGLLRGARNDLQYGLVEK